MMQDNEFVIKQGNEENTNPIEMAKLFVCIPPFWDEHPDIWFAQIEAQFATGNVVSDNAKFNYVVGNIEPKVLAQISDAVINPPETGKYDNLKKKILERFPDSKQTKMQAFLSEINLGDKKPSQLYRELKSITSDKVNNDFLKSLWLQRLPTPVQEILQGSNIELKDLPALADKIMEVCGFTQVNRADLNLGRDLRTSVSNSPLYATPVIAEEQQDLSEETKLIIKTTVRETISEMMGAIREVIRNERRNNNSKISFEYSQFELQQKFPLKTVSELQDFDQKLILSNEIQNNFKLYMSYVGGRNAKELVKILNRIYDLELQQKISYTGRENQKYAIMGHMHIKMLIEMLVIQYQICEKEAIALIQKFLHQTCDRLRSLKRKSDPLALSDPLAFVPKDKKKNKANK